MIEEVYYDYQILNMGPFCPYYRSYNVQSRDGGGNKMADTSIFGPIASTKMALEIAKELNWQRCVTLRNTELEGALYLVDCPSTRIYIQHLSKNRLTSIGDKWGILYPGISMTEEVYCDFQILNIAPFCPYNGSYNIQFRDGGRAKWRILAFSVQSRRQRLGRRERT
jgi:hypothetical protein